MKIRIRDKNAQSYLFLMIMVLCNLIVSLFTVYAVYQPQIHGVLKWLQTFLAQLT